MGMLTTGGNPIKWGAPENAAAKEYVREHGVKQFLNIWKQKKDVTGCPFLWGEEIEHFVVRKMEDGTIKLSLNAHEVIDQLVKRESICDWRPEYGSFMVESVPFAPYTMTAESLESVETNIATRCKMIDEAGDEQTFGVLLVSFPLMGVGQFTTNPAPHDAPYSKSLFVPDVCINGTHPRFSTLTQNIRLRRGRKVCIQVPMFIDKHTMERSVDKKFNIDITPVNGAIDCGAPSESKKTKKFGAAKTTPASPDKSGKPDFADEMAHLFTPATDYYYAQYEPSESRSYNVTKRYEACPCPVPSVSHPCIYMDCMAFGMGLNCLQVTMQLNDIDEARHLFDQLHVLCPPFLALSAATPFQKGMLCDSDVRWLTIAASVDDRQRSEVPRIMKSRYDAATCYISPDEKDIDQFNDNRIEIEPKFYDMLKKEGVDDRLARHIAHLFIRDPLTIFDRNIEIDDETRTDHFENIQSTNWQNVRFKPPPPGTDIGWRVEFRVMDVQPTPFENAALSVFITLLSRAILKFKARLYIKMTLTELNMGRAHRIDSCRTQKYFFRKNIFAEGDITAEDDEVVEYTMDELFNGCKRPDAPFEGLVAIVRRYCDEEGITSARLENMFDFIAQRAAGTIPTAANLLRKFVTSHPDYKQDSRLTQKISDDIIALTHDMGLGKVAPEGYIPEELLEGKKRKRND